MIGLDTNVLVRYVMQDDARQAARATRLIESLTAEQPGFLPLVVIVELVWVLSASYGLERPEIVETLDLLLRSQELVVDRADQVQQARRRFAETKSDFADCLIERVAHAKGCDRTVTFDHRAVKAAGMSPVP